MAEQNLSRPYVGYRSAGRRPEQQNDRVAAANAPLSAIRGFVAGTLGLPGDIEGLGRMVIPGVSNEPYLPNSEYFQGKLPMRSLQETPTGRFFTESGGLFGGTGLGTGVRAAGTGAMALGRAGERFAERVVPQVMERGGLGAELLQGLAQGTRSQVVKPKGGNWLAGSLEHVTDPLKTPVNNLDTIENARRMGVDIDPQVGAQAMNAWIDSKLKNYVKNEMATPEDPLRALAEKWTVDKPGLMAQAEAKLAGLNAKTQELAAQRGVPEDWLTSHRQDVLAAERARDTLEQRQALHTPGDPNAERWVPEYLEQVRRSEGFPPEGMGVGEPARAWEQLADEAINVGPASSHMRGVLTDSNLVANPWLAKVPPETRVYHTGRSNELGFDHLTDELRNALNPESGLPAELLMKYADLPKKTMTDVVTRVADINAWRAAQKAEADLAKANSAAVFTHKDYPEQGVAWKQLKTPEVKSVEELKPEQKSWYDEYIAGGVSHEAALKRSSDMGEGKDTLRDALKYEGDMMQHCVGSYCPDVSSGKNQIYSLRDTRGRPHATIEVGPGKGGPESLSKILQIKGLKNGPIDEKYLPMVQDFVRSSEWSDVADLQNTGLISGNRGSSTISDGPNRYKVAMPEAPYYTRRELADHFESQGVPALAAKQHAGDVEGLTELLTRPPAEGFAAGGYVDYDPHHADYLADNVRQGFAAGGAVNTETETNPYDETKIHGITAALHKEMTNGY